MDGWLVPAAVPAALDGANVVAVPSRLEGFGLAALEAALRARPVVASDVGGLPEVVGGTSTGVLIAAEDPDALATALVALLSDAPRAASIGRAARERALLAFPADGPVLAYDALHRRLHEKAAACGSCT